MESEQKAEAVHRLLTTANLHRMRGQLDEAVGACRQAIEADPDNAAAHDILGDLLVAQGQLPPAMESYRQAFELQPLPTTEEKIARLALRINQAKWAGTPGAGPAAGPKRQLNPSIACALSLLFPGLGQLYNGEHRKGGILFGVGMIVLLATAALGIPHARALSATLLGGVGRGGAAEPAPGFFWVLALALAGIWIYGLLDASLSAAAINRGERTEDRSGWEV